MSGASETLDGPAIALPGNPGPPARNGPLPDPLAALPGDPSAADELLSQGSGGHSLGRQHAVRPCPIVAGVPIL